MRNSGARIIILILFLGTGIGCGTFQSYAKWNNERCFVYSGVRYDYEDFTNTGPSTKFAALALARGLSGILSFLDIPFSFVTDTVALPGTAIQCTVFRISPLEVAARERPFLHGKHLDDGDMKKLSRMKDITDVFLDGSEVTDRGIRNLAGMTHLQRLSLTRTRVTGVGFSKFSGMRALYSLNLSNSKFEPKNLALLSRLPALKQLHLSETAVTDPDLKLVARLRGLRSLGLGKTGIDGSGFQYLKTIPGLKFIDVRGLNINTRAAGALISLPALEHLRLDHARIAFADLKRIARKSTMKQFQLAPRQFDTAQLRALKKINPRLKIYVGTPGSYREF